MLEQIGVPVKDWLATHPVEVHHVARLSVPMTVGTAVRGPFGTCLDRACADAQPTTLDVTVTKVPSSMSAHVELQLDFVSTSGGPRRLSVTLADQEPLVRSLEGAPEQTVVITPYYLVEPKQRSLDLLLQCASSRATKAADSQ